MSRLIDADELITAFPCGETVRTECVRATITHMPTVEERKTGRWLRTGRTNVFGGFEVECSNCHDTVMITHLEDESFCRHCGAKMEGCEA